MKDYDILYIENTAFFIYISLDIDECEINHPCQNGSTCLNVDGGYECDCADGYAGQNCSDGENQASGMND